MIQIALRLNSKSEKRPPIPNPTPAGIERKEINYNAMIYKIMQHKKLN